MSRLVTCLAILFVAPLAHAAPAQDTVTAADRTEVEARIVARCQGVLDELVLRGVSGASAGLVLADDSVLTVTAGFASVDEQAALQDSGRMLSGSVGKTYVTAVAHRLVLAGQLDLDARAATVFAEREPAPEWLDRVPNARVVTLRQLLRHQSGIPRYVFDESFDALLVSEPDRVWRPEELLAYVFDAEPLFAPGEGWAYADTNYIVVGMMIEQVTGRAFYDEAQEHFIAPLGLADTVPSNSRRIPGLVQGHVVAGQQMGVPERVLDDGVSVYNLQFEWCGGGWASTPRDLARWADRLYSGGAMEGPYLESLLDAVDAPGLGRGVRYGLGVMLHDTEAGPMRGHDGFMPGYLATMGYFPESDVAVALQLNTDDSRAVGRRLADVVVELASIAIEEQG